MIRNNVLRLALLVLALPGLPLSARATTASTTFQVSMTITQACSVTATNLGFGSSVSNATNVPEATPGTVTVTCSKSTPYTVGLTPSGANGGNSNGGGSMNGTGANTDKVPYALYSNAAHTTAWGNLAGTNTVSGTGTGSAAAPLSVYGMVPSANFTPDAYVDVVSVNVVY